MNLISLSDNIIINMDSVTHVENVYGKEEVRVYLAFMEPNEEDGGDEIQRTLYFYGDEADELWSRLTEYERSGRAG